MSFHEQIIHQLKLLDSHLTEKTTLVVCGGMAVALAFGGTRNTIDIDIIAPTPLGTDVHNAIAAVSKITGADHDWLNDSAKGFAEYLPQGWESRLVPINQEFNHLSLFSLGKPDLIMLKLKAARERDLADIETLKINDEDVRIILGNLPRIEKFDKKTALHIKLQLEEWGYET